MAKLTPEKEARLIAKIAEGDGRDLAPITFTRNEAKALIVCVMMTMDEDAIPDVAREITISAGTKLDEALKIEAAAHKPVEGGIN
jgi:hypothetical protein